MAFKDLNDPKCVLLALAEFDEIGRDRFLAKYGFHRSKRFMILHNDNLYDSKPVLSAAHGFQFGEALAASSFTGGLSGTVEKMRSLGFEVVNTDQTLPDKTDVEAALDLYDTVGRARFLAENNVSAAAKFLISARGNEYDAKAVLVVALRQTLGDFELSSEAVKSERGSVAVPLEQLGYKIVEKSGGQLMAGTEISGLIEEILDLQTKYTPGVNDAPMVERRSALEKLGQLLVASCGPSFGVTGGFQWTLGGDVSLGAGNVPKVAWVRLTDKTISPSAQAGWYVVLLFAADGSTCVVSLNQGTTSVSGPDKNGQIKAKAQKAFEFLDYSHEEGPGRGWALSGGVPSCRLAEEPDLRGGALGRSYEVGHVDGVVYHKGKVPSDGEIINHSKALLAMLGKLYDKDGGVMTDNGGTHVLLRWSENQANGFDTIAEHRQKLVESGSVVWAKFGASLSDVKVNELNEQIQAGIPTYAYLLGGASSKMFRATLTEIGKGTGSIDTSLIPSYYRDNLSGNETCFVFNDIDQTDLYPQLDDLLYLASNPEKKLTDSIRSQVNVLFVKERTPGVIPVAAAPSTPVVSEIMKVAETLNISVEEVQKLVAGVTGKKRQMILMGPPGTGKTFVAQQIAPLLVEDPSHIRLVQFHPSYGYEDFIEGLRPVPGDQGGFEFTRVPGALVELAEAITGNDITEGDGATRVLIIDEINRANISKVFGELMFLLEYRDQAMKLMLDDREFRLPENLIIIGTMNTADRSIRTLDVAMRRRFRFFELPSRSDIVERHYAKPNNSNQLGAELITGFEKLNAKLAEDVDRHHTIGHSYVLHRVMTAATLREVWEQEIFPLIEDYFFDRPDKAAEYDIKGFWPSV
jgi:hypothetical protein